MKTTISDADVAKFGRQVRDLLHRGSDEEAAYKTVYAERLKATDVTFQQFIDLVAPWVRRRQRDTSGRLRLPNLDPDFWTSRAALAHIRDAAWSRNRCPDAVLMAVLARVSSLMPPALRVDTGVGTPASLNMFSALVSPSGQGKTDAVGIALDLVRAEHAPVCEVFALRRMKGCEAHPDDLDPVCEACAVKQAHHQEPYLDVPLGSGEGLAEVFMGKVRQGRTVARRQVRGNAMVWLDEGEALLKIRERNGSTVGAMIRSAWVGSTIGQMNASEDRTRVIPRGSYSLGLVAGFQPEVLGPLLDDHGPGTPQRFVYVSAVDPAIPLVRPNYPGELAIAWPRPVLNVDGRAFMPVEDEVLEEIQDMDSGRARGEWSAAPLDSHEVLTQVKLAGLLAVLDGRTDINVVDWHLSGAIWAVSCGVRDHVLSLCEREESRKVQEADRRHTDRAVATEEAIVTRALTAACKYVVSTLGRHHHDTVGCPRTCLNQAIPSRIKRIVSVDNAIDELLQQKLIARVKPGPDDRLFGPSTGDRYKLK